MKQCVNVFLPQAGQGMDTFPTKHILSQGNVPVSKASISHNVRTGMLEQVSQAIVAVSHLKGINNTWTENLWKTNNELSNKSCHLPFCFLLSFFQVI